jgi:hypothetical protein
MTEAEWLVCASPFDLYGLLRAETITYKTRWQGWMTAPRYPVSDRRLRLFFCGCCARIADLMPTPEARAVLTAAEAYADGQIDDDDLENAARACEQIVRGPVSPSARWLSYEHEAVRAANLVHRSEAAGRLGALAAAARAWAGGNVWRRHVKSLGGVLRVDPREFAPLESVVRTCDRAFTNELSAESRLQATLLRDVVGNPFQPCTIDPAWLEWNDGTIARLASSIYQERRFGDVPILADALEDAGCRDDEFLSHCRGGGPHIRGCWVIDSLSGRK